MTAVHRATIHAADMVGYSQLTGLSSRATDHSWQAAAASIHLGTRLDDL
jgi:hypothetical protein